MCVVGRSLCRKNRGSWGRPHRQKGRPPHQKLGGGQGVKAPCIVLSAYLSITFFGKIYFPHITLFVTAPRCRMREDTTLRVEFNVDGTWYGKRMDLDSPDLRLQVPPPVNHSSQHVGAYQLVSQGITYKIYAKHC